MAGDESFIVLGTRPCLVLGIILLYPPVGGEIERHIDMILGVTKSHFLKKAKSRHIVCLGIHEKHPHSILQHEIPKPVEELCCSILSLERGLYS